MKKQPDCEEIYWKLLLIKESPVHLHLASFCKKKKKRIKTIITDIKMFYNFR